MTRFVVAYDKLGFHTRLLDVSGAKKPTDPRVVNAVNAQVDPEYVKWIIVNDGEIPIGDWATENEFDNYRDLERRRKVAQPDEEEEVIEGEAEEVEE
jgi:hypothetical protein